MSMGPAIASGRLCIRDPSEGKIRHLGDDPFYFICDDDHRVCLLVCLLLFTARFIYFFCLFICIMGYYGACMMGY